MTIRDRIQKRLTALDISARGASLAAGLNTHFLQKYLSNEDHSIKVNNLLALAKVLEVSPEWLLTGAGDDEPRESAEVVDIWESILKNASETERDAWLNMVRAIAGKKE